MEQLLELFTLQGSKVSATWSPNTCALVKCFHINYRECCHLGLCRAVKIIPVCGIHTCASVGSHSLCAEKYIALVLILTNGPTLK
jgi:hypothetical protein